MDDFLYTIAGKDVEHPDAKQKNDILASLEEGKIIFLKDYSLLPTEADKQLLTDSFLDKRSKNISYDYTKNKVSGAVKSSDLEENLHQFMHRYAMFAKHLVDNLLPKYNQDIIWGRTSYRPAEIKGRASSKRKDDTRIHVDSFPATPVAGKRILRVFCNVNPYGEARTWHVGEPFKDLLQKFANDLPSYSSFKANLLKLAKATKSKRTAYDHYMLNLHDTMKLNEDYQANLNKARIDFPPNSTWIVYTDHVSHAALSGQFLLEQTFYLPPEKMSNPDLAPLSYLENAGLI